MADNSCSEMVCTPCSDGLCGGKGVATLKDGIWTSNPLAIQILGICSALAVTTKLENSIVMGCALIFVGVCSNLLVSLLRKMTPRRIRMIAEVVIIATYVIVFDLLLKAYYWEMSGQLGPYVGLIITNCIIMGRAEAFAMQNRPIVSMVDGLANGLGYAVILAIIGFIREVLGSGQLTWAGETLFVIGWYPTNLLIILAPGAFIVLGFCIAGFNALKGPDAEEDCCK